MTKLIPIAAIAVFALLFSCNNENNSNKEAKEENKERFDSSNIKRDAEFAVKAASGGMMEVELGNVAMTNGVSQSVKQFGKDMVTDHSKANDELKAAAASKNIALPAVPDNSMQKKINDLKQKHGADFDKAYIDMMVSDHKEDIDLFQKEAGKGNDGDLKAWAAGKVQTLQHHLMMAQDIQGTLKK